MFPLFHTLFQLSRPSPALSAWTKHGFLLLCKTTMLLFTLFFRVERLCFLISAFLTLLGGANQRAVEGMSTVTTVPTVLLIGKNPKARILTLYDLVPMQIVDLQPWNNIIILIPTKELTNCQTWL